jgi:hypothetical protein
MKRGSGWILAACIGIGYVVYHSNTHNNVSATNQQITQSTEKTTGSAPSPQSQQTVELTIQSPAHSSGGVSIGEDNVSQAAAISECGPGMSQSECDRKIERDLGSAIRNKAKGCRFEPDWRPTNLKERTLHLSEVDGSTIVIALDGHSYVLRESACEDRKGQSCSQWKPEVGADYHATITDRPEYLNDCLHRVLPAEREVCIGFGKEKQETLAYGVSRTPEHEVCYSVSVKPVELSAQVRAATTTAPAAAQASAREPAPLSNDNYYTNSDGNRVNSPAYSPGSVPAGATAVCRDGTYSFSQHRQGTCSHHGGVANWL